MDAARRTIADLWTQLRPDAPGIVTVLIAVLTIILLLCIGHKLVADEQRMQEGMVGGSVGAPYPGVGGGLHPMPDSTPPPSPPMILYVEPGGVGRVLAPCAQGTTPSSCTATEPGPVFENVAFDPRWLGARDGRFFGPMSWAN